MPYATKDDIQADFKDMEFTTTSNVKIADVEQFILESDALINAYVGARYVVPVTAGTSALNFLKLLTRSLTAARVKRITEVKQEKSTDANQNILTVLFSPSNVMKILEDIKKGSVVLDGATPLLASSGFYSNNAANSVCPVIKKDEKQW